MEKAEWVKKVLNLPPQKRIRKFKYKKPKLKSKNKISRQKIEKKQRRMRTPMQLIQMCNSKKIFSVRQLNEYNRNNQEKIYFSQIKHWFGSWSAFKLRLDIDYQSKYKFREEDVIDACVRFKVKRAYDFQQAHKKQPNLFPSYDWVQRHFGQWKFFKKILQASSVQSVLERYVRKKIQLGRYPSKEQCRKCSIQIQLLLKIWSPQQLKQTVQLLQGVYKNAK